MCYTGVIQVSEEYVGILTEPESNVVAAVTFIVLDGLGAELIDIAVNSKGTNWMFPFSV